MLKRPQCSSRAAGAAKEAVTDLLGEQGTEPRAVGRIAMPAGHDLIMHIQGRTLLDDPAGEYIPVMRQARLPTVGVAVKKGPTAVEGWRRPLGSHHRRHPEEIGSRVEPVPTACPRREEQPFGFPVMEDARSESGPAPRARCLLYGNENIGVDVWIRVSR